MTGERAGRRGQDAADPFLSHAEHSCGYERGPKLTGCVLREYKREKSWLHAIGPGPARQPPPCTCDGFIVLAVPTRNVQPGRLTRRRVGSRQVSLCLHRDRELRHCTCRLQVFSEPIPRVRPRRGRSPWRHLPTGRRGAHVSEGAGEVARALARYADERRVEHFRVHSRAHIRVERPRGRG